MSLVRKLDAFPPCLVRLVARDPRKTGRRLSILELSKRMRISYGATLRLSQKRSWENVPAWLIDRFTSACGVDPLRPGQKLKYLRRVLSAPDGYKKLAARRGGWGSPKRLVRMLEDLNQ